MLNSNYLVLKKVIKVIFWLYIPFLFWTMGSGKTIHQQILQCLGLFAVGSLVLSYKKLGIRSYLTCASFYPFVLFLIFLCIRFLLKADTPEYFASIYWWSLYGILFIAAYQYFSKRDEVFSLLSMTSWAVFFMAINFIPGLFKEGQHWYGYPSMWGNYKVNFFPWLYPHPFFEWIFSYKGHQNINGDILAFGFFSALGLAVYALVNRKPEGSGSSVIGSKASWISLWFVMAFVSGTAVFLFFSRGTIAFFVLTLLVTGFLTVLKFRTPLTAFIVGGIFILFFAFLAWGGNLGKAIEEVQTLEQENAILKGESESKRGSVIYNIEGARRGLAMHKDHFPWGVGRRGYFKYSSAYADTPERKKLNMIKTTTMSHYMTVLAEEGVGSYFYFLFLAVYLAEVLWRGFRTSSRFQFISAMALFSPVFLILTHSSIFYTMERYYSGFLVYGFMGASLGVLKKSFSHSGNRVE